MPELEGTMLGRYYLKRKLGYGGMSEVYLAHDEFMNRDVAIKVVSSIHTDYLERFHREAEAIANLNHDHILPAFDYGEQDPWHYLVMPYMPFGTLRELLLEGPLTPEEAGEMLDQVASALQFAHDHGIIHRDIKPSNILLRDDHYVYLADFGLAKALEDTSALTQTGILLGTPEYMAPDLATGPATTSSDIYALGVMLYQMVTGQVPFNAPTPLAIYWKHIREQPAPPSHLNPQLSPAIDSVILHALEKEPHNRFHTAQALANAYRQALHSSAPHAIAEAEYDQPVQEEPASFADTVSIHPPRDFTPSPQHGKESPQPDKLVLPGNPLVAPSAINRERKRRSAFTSLPPLPIRSRSNAIAHVAPPPTPQPKTMRSYPTRKGLATSIVISGLLIFVALPMSFIYYIFVSHTQTATTTKPPIGTQSINGAQAVPTATTHPIPIVTVTTNATSSTPAATATINPTGGTPFLTDSLAGNTNGRWTEIPTTCVFTGGTYHVYANQADTLQPCKLLGIPNLDNVTVQVDVSLLTGNNAGVLLRLKGERFYDFEINNQGQFFFRRHDTGAGANYTDLIKPTSSSAIAAIGQKNTLVVVAAGDDFKLYINGTFVGDVQDNTYADGQLALATGTLAPTTNADGSFSNLKLFKAS